MALTIQQLREEKGLTVEELAEATGVKVKTIKAIESKDMDKVYVKDIALLGSYFKESKIQDLTVF